MKYKNLMAKALYDNVPESPEELAFRKGDILTVIEQNTGGLEGWWLCSLHGRQGIAPGNRLKLLIGPAFEAQPSGGGAAPQQTSGDGAAQGIYQVPSSLQSPQQSPYQVPPGQDVYQVPPRSHLAADSPASKVVTPTRVGQSYTFSPGQLSQQDLYDVPPIRAQQGVYDVPPAQTGSAQTSSGRNRGVYDLPPPPGVYSVPPSRTNAALQEGNYDVPQPLRPQQEGIYDVPPPLTSAGPPSLYDVPPPLTSAGPPSLYDAPPPLTSAGPPSLYDFPPSPEPLPRHANANEGIYDVPPPALHSGAGPQTDVYDVPRPAQDAGAAAEVAEGVNRLSFSSTASSRSSMSTSSSSAGSEGRLPLDADAALQRLQRLQQAVELSIGVLHTMAASPRWRTLPFMERHANDVRGVLDRLRAALGDLVAFGRGAAANAAALPDPGLHTKLRRQLARLEDSQQILLQIHQALEGCGWAPHALASSGRSQHKSHDLDRLLMVSRSVPDDAKQLASAVGGSAELLFRRAAQEENLRRPLGSPSSDSRRAQKKKLQSSSSPDKDSEKCVKSWMEDYDYVHLQGKDDFERQQKELLDKENIMKQSQSQLGQEQIKQFRKLEQEVIKPVENDITQWVSLQRASSPADSSSSSSSTSASVCARDRQLLAFYSEQCQQHFVTLLSAVDAFFGCVGAGQPPRIFVAHSKFVILSAHKLVFIGDTLSRQAAAPEVANRVMNCSNVLCDLLKTVVAATKTAALNYPNTAAVQEMVDRVTELSHHAQHFKEQLLQMAAL